MTGAATENPDQSGKQTGARLALHYSAISDVGRVRQDNQDAGYAGPWVLVVCDGVGGAARGDIASSAAVRELRELDLPPGDDDLLRRVGRGLERAHVAIGRLVDEDAELKGTSTTATVALFDGTRVGLGHVGDSRAYLYRQGELSQLTTDHTFVQTLIDEGRISEDDARKHPHRNVILKALDGVHDLEPDLFALEVVAGDRLLVCSDGASGVLSAAQLAAVLREGTPDYAAVELVRASLEAGSTDNVTCLVADVLDESSLADDPGSSELEPLLVGAASELRRRGGRGSSGGPIAERRSTRTEDTGELQAVTAGGAPADAPAVDAETARYAPREPRRLLGLRRFLALLVVLGLLWVVGAGAYAWSQRQYYVGEQDGVVTIFRGVDAQLPGLALSRAYETSNVELDRLYDFDATRVTEGVDVADLEAAREAVENLAAKQRPDTGDGG